MEAEGSNQNSVYVVYASRRLGECTKKCDFVIRCVEGLEDVYVCVDEGLL